MKNQPYVVVFVLMLFLYSCSRKTIPAENPKPASTGTISTKDSVITSIPGTPGKDSAIAPGPPKPKVAVVKTPVPKSITVNDQAAKKTADGRYYYDLEGKRYWRNKKDGKYYLYYKGMFENKDFQK